MRVDDRDAIFVYDMIQAQDMGFELYLTLNGRVICFEHDPSRMLFKGRPRTWWDRDVSEHQRVQKRNKSDIHATVVGKGSSSPPALGCCPTSPVSSDRMPRLTTCPWHAPVSQSATEIRQPTASPWEASVLSCCRVSHVVSHTCLDLSLM